MHWNLGSCLLQESLQGESRQPCASDLLIWVSQRWQSTWSKGLRFYCIFQSLNCSSDSFPVLLFWGLKKSCFYNPIFACKSHHLSSFASHRLCHSFCYKNNLFFFLFQKGKVNGKMVLCIIGRLFIGCCLSQSKEASLSQTHNSPWSVRRLTGPLWGDVVALWVEGIFFGFCPILSMRRGNKL